MYIVKISIQKFNASDTGGQYPMFPVSAFVARRMTLTIVYLANGGHMSTSGTTPYETHMQKF